MPDQTLVATPSGCDHIAAAFGGEGWNVVAADQHIREHLLAIDPPISGEAVLVNRGSGGRLSQKLAEMRQQLVARAHRSGRTTADVHPGYRVTITRHDRDGEIATYDLFVELAGRHPELRRMIEATRGLLPHPTFEDNTAITGVDTDAQAALLPDGVRVIAIAGQTPPWTVDVPAGDLFLIDSSLSLDKQAAAALEAVREPVAV